METEIMNHNYTHKRISRSSLARRVGWLGLIAILGFGLLCPLMIRESAGQGKVPSRTTQKQQKPQVEMKQTTDLPKIVSVRGDGRKAFALRTREKQVEVPPPLSEEVKNSLIKSAGVKQPKPHDSFKLTPAKPTVVQGTLAFEQIQYLDPKANELTIGNLDSFYCQGQGSTKAVFLYMEMTAGKKYLIDFTVTGEKFFVSDSGNLKETFSGTHHVLIIYEGTGTPMIALTGRGAGGASVWRLHSCEVTTLN